MNRWTTIAGCIALGLLTLVCGLLVPAHMRSVDESVIERAGRNSPTFVESGLALVNQQKPGPARLLLQAAQDENLPGQGTLRDALDTLKQRNPGLQILGCAEPRLDKLAEFDPTQSRAEPFTELVIHLEVRERALDLLQASPNPAVQELMRFRGVTNTALFPPSTSTSGQALDAALATGGLLFETGHLTAGLSNSVFALVRTANHGNSEPFEQFLMDLLSLGQRFDWGQLVEFTGRIEDVGTLRLQANLVRKAEAKLPVLFAAVQLSGQPAAVAEYLMTFSQSGMKDLGASLRHGAGGVDELVRRGERLHTSWVPWHLGVGTSLRAPRFALVMRWTLILCGGFLFAMALHFARPAATALEGPLQVRGIHLAREFLFALGFLFVVMLLSEPFLAQDSQRAEYRFQLRLPTVGNPVPTGSPAANATFMNQTVLLTMLLFFVLQALLYVMSLVKLAEIRRQRVLARVKLRLLENEDHLFDAGLYLGFLGTIVSFILVSVGVFKQPSLMAAYSSTSFGILFVVLFKVVHLRPARRTLLMESEAGPAEPPPVPQAAPRPYAA